MKVTKKFIEENLNKATHEMSENDKEVIWNLSYNQLRNLNKKGIIVVKEIYFDDSYDLYLAEKKSYERILCGDPSNEILPSEIKKIKR